METFRCWWGTEIHDQIEKSLGCEWAVLAIIMMMYSNNINIFLVTLQQPIFQTSFNNLQRGSLLLMGIVLIIAQNVPDYLSSMCYKLGDEFYGGSRFDGLWWYLWTSNVKNIEKKPISYRFKLWEHSTYMLFACSVHILSSEKLKNMLWASRHQFTRRGRVCRISKGFFHSSCSGVNKEKRIFSLRFLVVFLLSFPRLSFYMYIRRLLRSIYSPADI